MQSICAYTFYFFRDSVLIYFCALAKGVGYSVYFLPQESLSDYLFTESYCMEVINLSCSNSFKTTAIKDMYGITSSHIFLFLGTETV